MQDKDLQLRPGERFLDFQSLAVLGRGGVGEVHKIRYRQELQALKIIRAEWVQNPGMCARMLNEGQILTRINHPNIVSVHDAGMTSDNRVWIRMELLDGLNLRELMRRSRRLSLARMCAFLRSAAHALHQCHLFGIVHRDVKPENFMVVRDEDGSEVVKLLDFGLAKLYGAETQDLALIGTPQYMAPEQWDKRRKVTPATDLYSLGLMGCEMFDGCHPLFSTGEALSPLQMMHEHFYTMPSSPETRGMPKSIAKLVMKTLRKDPAERPEDALEWAEKLWKKWRKIRDADPETDTLPGEPPLERIVSRPIVVQGTSPVGAASVAVTSVAVTSVAGASVAGASVAEEAPAPPAETAPLKHATTIRMVPPPVPDALPAASPGRAPAGAAGGVPIRTSLTVKLPDPQRDPSCVTALEQRHAAATASTAPVSAAPVSAAPVSTAPVSTATASTALLAVPLQEVMSGVQAIDPARALSSVAPDELDDPGRETPEPAPESSQGPARIAERATRAESAKAPGPEGLAPLSRHARSLAISLAVSLALGAGYAALRWRAAQPAPPAGPVTIPIASAPPSAELTASAEPITAPSATSRAEPAVSAAPTVSAAPSTEPVASAKASARPRAPSKFPTSGAHAPASAPKPPAAPTSVLGNPSLDDPPPKKIKLPTNLAPRPIKRP